MTKLNTILKKLQAEAREIYLQNFDTFTYDNLIAFYQKAVNQIHNTIDSLIDPKNAEVVALVELMEYVLYFDTHKIKSINDVPIDHTSPIIFMGQVNTLLPESKEFNEARRDYLFAIYSSTQNLIKKYNKQKFGIQ